MLSSRDNEGTYRPRCRLNWIAAPGFYIERALTSIAALVHANVDLPRAREAHAELRIGRPKAVGNFVNGLPVPGLNFR